MAIDKLRAITYFVRSADSGSFAAAARSLDVSASALSKALAALEEDVGFALFNRSTRRLALTDDGRAYVECCRGVLRQLEGAESAGRGARVDVRGTLRFGIHPALRLALLRRLDRFLAAHQRLRLDMMSTNAPSALLDHGLDVVFCIGELPDSELVAIPLGWTRFVICGSPAYLEARGEPAHPSDLAAHDGVVYTMPDEASATRWELQRGEEVLAVAPPIRLAVRDGAGAIDAALHGCGLARPFEVAVRPELESGRLRGVLPGWSSPPQPVFAVVAGGGPPPAKVRALVEFVRTLP